MIGRTEIRLEEIAKGQTLLRAMKDNKLWRVMIAHILKGHGIQKKVTDFSVNLQI